MDELISYINFLEYSLYPTFIIIKYISPFLKFIKIKRKRRKEILKMKRLYPFAGRSQKA